MTVNQLRFRELLENERANLVNEDIKQLQAKASQLQAEASKSQASTAFSRLWSYDMPQLQGIKENRDSQSRLYDAQNYAQLMKGSRDENAVLQNLDAYTAGGAFLRGTGIGNILGALIGGLL